MLLLGLTGSIATGKSTVSRLLSSAPYALPIIDADVLAREVVEPGASGYKRIVAYFGPTTSDLLLPSGALDRSVLGRRVFGSDPDRIRDRGILNSIIHPLVRRAMYRAILREYLRGSWCVVLDVPLLIEAGLDVICGGVVLVACKEEVQMERLIKRDGGKGLTREDAEKRVGSQMPLQEKRNATRGCFESRGRGWILENDGSLEELEEKLKAVMQDARRGRGVWWRTLLWFVPPLAVADALRVFLGNWLAKRRWRAQTKKE